MKKILILYLLLFAFGSMFAQKPSIATKQKKNYALPKSLFNLDLNFSYTSLFTKIMIGSSNTGIIIRASKSAFDKLPSDASTKSIGLGYQKRILGGLYANLSSEFHKIKTDDYSKIIYDQSESDRSQFWAATMGLGYTVSIGKVKRFYFNYEMDYSYDFGSLEIDNNLRIMFGIGYRFGAPAKTSYDGIKNITTVPLKP